MRIVILLLMLSAFIFGSGLKWVGSMQKAFEVAKKVHKPIMVFVEASHCPWCSKMLHTTLEEKDTIKVLNRDYVLVKIDIDSADGQKYFANTAITPTIYFLSYKKEPLIAIEGFVEEDIFYMDLEDVDKRLKELGYK